MLEGLPSGTSCSYTSTTEIKRDGASYLSGIDIYDYEHIYAGEEYQVEESSNEFRFYNTFSAVLDRLLFPTDGKYEITTTVSVADNDAIKM